jgi:hypothetical protein
VAIELGAATNRMRCSERERSIARVVASVPSSEPSGRNMAVGPSTAGTALPIEELDVLPTIGLPNSLCVSSLYSGPRCKVRWIQSILSGLRHAHKRTARRSAGRVTRREDGGGGAGRRVAARARAQAMATHSRMGTGARRERELGERRLPTLSLRVSAESALRPPQLSRDEDDVLETRTADCAVHESDRRSVLSDELRRPFGFVLGRSCSRARAGSDSRSPESTTRGPSDSEERSVALLRFLSAIRSAASRSTCRRCIMLDECKYLRFDSVPGTVLPLKPVPGFAAQQPAPGVKEPRPGAPDDRARAPIWSMPAVSDVAVAS